MKKLLAVIGNRNVSDRDEELKSPLIWFSWSLRINIEVVTRDHLLFTSATDKTFATRR
jgi:hypothetical protein